MKKLFIITMLIYVLCMFVSQQSYAFETATMEELCLHTKACIMQSDLHSTVNALVLMLRIDRSQDTFDQWAKIVFAELKTQRESMSVINPPVSEVWADVWYKDQVKRLQDLLDSTNL